MRCEMGLLLIYTLIIVQLCLHSIHELSSDVMPDNLLGIKNY